MFSGFGWLAVVALAVAGACAPPGAPRRSPCADRAGGGDPGRHRHRRDDTETVADSGGHRSGDSVRDRCRGRRGPDVSAGFGAGAGDLRAGWAACPGQDDAH